MQPSAVVPSVQLGAIRDSAVPFVLADLTVPKQPRYSSIEATATLPLTDTLATSEQQRRSLPLQRTELLLIFAFWTALAVLNAASRLLDPRGPALQQPFPSSTPITLAFAEYYLWAVLTVPIFWLASRVSLEPREPIRSRPAPARRRCDHGDVRGRRDPLHA